MNFKSALSSSFSAIGSTFSVIESSAQYAENFVSEALEVQEQTRQVRINQAVDEALVEATEASKKLLSNFTALTDKELAELKQLRKLK